MSQIDEGDPSKVNDTPWLFCIDPVICSSYSEPDGKWMMFFKKENLDQKWREACSLYLDGKLTGIYSLKVSTNFDNPRASSKNEGVIIFFCGPSNNKDLMISFGQNILKHMDYKNKNGYMAYKSNEQTVKGTRATGQKINHLYRIPLE